MSQASRIIKKYPNRRLYDTETSSNITLQDVKKLVLDHVEFRVEDAKTKDDLTRPILLQIILDEETAGAPMFSSDMLSQIIRFYGNAMQGMMGSFLEKNIQTFMEIQNRLQEVGGGGRVARDLTPLADVAVMLLQSGGEGVAARAVGPRRGAERGGRRAGGDRDRLRRRHTRHRLRPRPS